MASTEGTALAWTYDRLHNGASAPSTLGTGGTPTIYYGMPAQDAPAYSVVIASLASTDNTAFGPTRLPARVVVLAKIVARGIASPETLEAEVTWLDQRLQSPAYAPVGGAVLCANREREVTLIEWESGVPVTHRGAEYALTTTPG